MEEDKVTDLTTPVEQPTAEGNGNEPWSISNITRGASDRLNEINEQGEH